MPGSRRKRPPVVVVSESGSEPQSGSEPEIYIPRRRIMAGPMPGGPPQKPKAKYQSPQQTVDEFWAKFTTKHPGRVTAVIPHPKEVGLKSASSSSRTSSDPSTPTSTAEASYEAAAALCRDKVDKIVKECRRVNKKYRDVHFDLEWDLKFARRECLESLPNMPGPVPGSSFDPQSVKRVPDVFDQPHFYVDGPSANDVRQGRDGDCWLMAALCTLSNKPGLIERVCVVQDQDVGVYGFVFHRDGEWISEIIDDQLYLTKPDYDESHQERILWEDRDRVNSEESYRKIYQANSGALYFAQSSDANETWLPLLEKCYAKAHGDYAAIEGGFGGEAIEDLTGGVTSELYTTDILDKEHFWQELLKANDEFLFGCSTGVWQYGRQWGERRGIVEKHAYSVMRTIERDGRRLVLLRNPWGKGEWTGPWSDGSKEWTAEWLQKLDHRFGDDGAFWISYQDLLRKYQVFERTRLFGPEWRIASEWATLDVPWTLEYHDTYFTLSLARTGPVVIVLSQLDDRYFRSLEGQYSFRLAFRIHKPGQESYIVRTEAPLRMSRSVNVDLELEAGDYDVRIKVEARRDPGVMPVEDVLRANAPMRRDKLMRVGLAFDFAHSKGRIVETADEKAAREAFEKRRKDKDLAGAKKKLLENREIDHYMKKKERQRQKRHQAKFRAKRKDKMEKKQQLSAAGAEAAAAAVMAVHSTDGHVEEEGQEGKQGRQTGHSAEKDENGQQHEHGHGHGHEHEHEHEHEQALIQAKDQDGSKDSQIPDQKGTGSKTAATTAATAATTTAATAATAASDADVARDTPATVDSSWTAATAPETLGNTPKTPKTPFTPATAASVASPAPADAADAAKAKHVDFDVAPDDQSVVPAISVDKQSSDTDKACGVEEQSKHGLGLLNVPTTEEGDAQAAHSGEEGGLLGRGLVEAPEGEDVNSPALSHVGGPPSLRHAATWPPGPPPPPPPSAPEGHCESDSDDVESLSDLSEMSDRELDIIVRSRRPASPDEGDKARGPDGQPHLGDDSSDELEADPWNAVVVVGLRVYYKVDPETAAGGGGGGGGGQKAEEEEERGVKIGVVRSSPWEEDDEAKGSKVLDVDDSSKDATLVGKGPDKRKSIVPDCEG